MRGRRRRHGNGDGRESPECCGGTDERCGHGHRGLELRALTLADLKEGEVAVLEALELPEEDALRLMELGFIPGIRVEVGPAAPGGCPRVYRVDGGEVALRRRTARHLRIRRET